MKSGQSSTKGDDENLLSLGVAGRARNARMYPDHFLFPSPMLASVWGMLKVFVGICDSLMTQEMNEELGV